MLWSDTPNNCLIAYLHKIFPFLELQKHTEDYYEIQRMQHLPKQAMLWDQHPKQKNSKRHALYSYCSQSTEQNSRQYHRREAFAFTTDFCI